MTRGRRSSKCGRDSLLARVILAAALLGAGCASSAADDGSGGAGAGGSSGTSATGGTGPLAAGTGGAADARGSVAGSGGKIIDAAGPGGASPANAGSGGASNTASGGSSTAGGRSSTAGGASSTAGGGSSTAGSGGGSASPAVRIVGRTASNGAGARFGWPGVALLARFKGTRASIQLNDGNGDNAFEVVLDDQPPKKFRTKAGQTSYPLATDLPDGEHRVLVWRSTERFDTGNTDFVAIGEFGEGGALLAPPAAPERRIEVIGDSISVGAGLEGGPANCAANKSSTDNYYAYGSVAARALGADIATIAYSGIGVYRSYGGGDPTMPQRYDRALPNDDVDWDFSKYQPHVVVITLGTNDFGSGSPGQPYVDTYVSFAKHVRSKYPNAYFILAAMYSNQEAPIGNVVNNLKGGGDSQVELLTFDSVQNNEGCAQHPDKAAQQAMGELLANRIKAILHW
jgi:lysophospholipase L1-like esterase